jgi:hypothetical protein
MAGTVKEITVEKVKGREILKRIISEIEARKEFSWKDHKHWDQSGDDYWFDKSWTEKK